MIRNGWPVRYIEIPQTCRIIKGDHKDWNGEIWEASDKTAQIVTPQGIYITEPIENLEILSTKRKAVIV